VVAGRGFEPLTFRL